MVGAREGRKASPPAALAVTNRCWPPGHRSTPRQQMDEPVNRVTEWGLGWICGTRLAAQARADLKPRAFLSAFAPRICWVHAANRLDVAGDVRHGDSSCI